ncbi:hypothetical protein [Marinoscillum furvescens]|uniref:Uncharacterized protein n=1 Tax=Marinoscillum furvescens DSM 4134 TaxID=1122208 RepID=A0A3D9L1U7_MARFU|nr:hypothetical protein [Marinoscillum furvescens]RED98015.1 hypothetical protein C7460_111157 [Marinoscillum furvescens DSM 4134]
MKLIGYISVIVIFFGTLFIIDHYTGHDKPAIISEEAVEPDLHLSNSKLYFQEHAHERSLQQLDAAIDAIREIEQDIDEESRKKVEASVVELEEIKDEMAHGNFDLQKFNDASVKALNALTYAELKITEHFVESHEKSKAKLALKYGMVHVKNALMFSQGKKKEYEIHIYSEIDSLMENQSLTDQEIIDKLESMLKELDESGL